MSAADVWWLWCDAVRDLAVTVSAAVAGLDAGQWALVWLAAVAVCAVGLLWCSRRWWRDRALRAEEALADRRAASMSGGLSAAEEAAWIGILRANEAPRARWGDRR